MKILLINHFPLEGSGSGTYTRNIAQYLVKRGHQVCVVFPETDIQGPLADIKLHPVYFTQDQESRTGLAPKEILVNALPFNFPCFTTHPRSLRTFGDLDDTELKQYLDAFKTALIEECESFKPDLIHGQHIWCLSWLAAGLGIPSVITAHGTDLMGYDKWPQFRKYAEEAVEKCSRILAISRDNMQAALERFPQAEGKITLLSNGYNEDVFYREMVNKEGTLEQNGVPYKGEKLVLFAGKLTAFKGVDTLLRAVKLYEEQQPGKIITMIAGSGQEEKMLKELQQTLQLKSLYFLGHKNQAELRKLYNMADVFAMPSRKEPFGLVALEAMACGLPVVASNEGGLPEFVNEKVGALVPADDPSVLCTAILNELDRSEADPKRKDLISEYARSDYTQSQFIIKLEKIYEELLTEHSK
ncbi:MAG: glycosyltransferase family 4 protein [Bacillota bacterium]|nr:glycosyltransferase family 4 protein [Bacillota bacterium]